MASRTALDFHDSTDASARLSAQEEQSEQDLLRKCEVDPIKAQDDALISIALKLREGRMAVNDVQVDEARTTMVRSNYAPDWTRAHWDHPLLANLKNLSVLSSSDLPSHTKRGLVDERKAIDRVASEQQQQQEQQQQPRAITAAGENTELEQQQLAIRSQHSLDAVRAEIADPEALRHAIEHGVNAVFEMSPFLLRQKALLSLSSETINSDPQLLALVSAVAQSNKNDPVVAGRVAMGETPTIPVTVMVPSMRSNVPSRRRATDALPHAGSRGDTNRGFHASDIAEGYERLRTDLSPERLEKERQKSMHDVGYLTWCQKHLENPSEYEDLERYAEYRDTMTSLQGKSAAMVALAERNGARE